MLEKIYWILEIISLAVCINCLHGVKIKADIKTIVFIAIEVMFMDLFERGIITNRTYFIIYILYVLYVYLEFKSSLRSTIFSAVLSIIIVGFIQMIIAFPIYEIGDCIKASENIMVLIINTFVFLSILIISRTKRLHHIYELFARKELILNITFLVIMLIYFYCLYLLKDSEKIQTDMYVIIITLAVSIGCILFRWQVSEKETRDKQHQIDLSNQYSDEYNSLVEISRKKQHEFNNQINALYGMQHIASKAGKEEQKSYIDKVLENNKITKILNSVEQPVLAGFLYRKVSEIIESGIDIKLNLLIPENEFGIELFDCIEILGILLDNAVEAIRDNIEEKEIILELVAVDGNITISVKNTSRYYENDEIAKFFQKDYSTKGENRGIGLAKIKDLQRKYKYHILVEMQEIYNKDWISFSIIKK